jgi:hypothetical protein
MDMTFAEGAFPARSRIPARALDAVRAGTSAWRTGGPRGAVRLLLEALYWRYHPRVRRWMAELPRQQQLDKDFDRRFSVDTAGHVALAEVGVEGVDIERGHGFYRPVWSSVFHEAMGALPADLERFSLVDYGSGKGKALLLASDYPFREIIGIEFARPLHEIAERNIARYAAAGCRCSSIRSECVDASRFEPPSGPLVCFFFNPFDDTTMNDVIGSLYRSFRASPRDILLVYTNMRHVAEHAKLFRKSACLLALVKSTRYMILTIRP